MKLVPKQPLETADVSRGKLSWPVVLRTFAGAILFFVVAYLLLALVGSWVGSKMPDSWEAKVGRTLDVHVFGQPVEEGDSRFEDLAELEAIFAELTADTDLRDLPYQIQILKDPMPNAFAVPGGTIFFTSGLLELVESRAGRAFVLAHELGHHEQRHVFRNVGRTAAVQILAASLGVGSLDGAIFGPANQSNSRAMEKEADEFALRLTLEKLGDSEEILEFLDNVLAQERRRSRLLSYLETHPMTEDRINHLEALRYRLLTEEP